MINTLETCTIPITPPAAIVDNAAFTTTEIDRVINGVPYDYLDIYVLLGALDIAIATMKVAAGNASGVLTDIPGTIFGATGNPALPSATDDNKLYCFHINACDWGRFFDLVLVGGDGSAGTYACAWAVLSRGKESPDTAAARGLAAEVFV